MQILKTKGRYSIVHSASCPHCTTEAYFSTTKSSCVAFTRLLQTDELRQSPSHTFRHVREWAISKQCHGNGSERLWRSANDGWSPFSISLSELKANLIASLNGFNVAWWSLVLVCLVLLCQVWRRLVLPCLVLPCLLTFLSRVVLSCLALPSLALPCLA